MTPRRIRHAPRNPWKWAAIGMGLVGGLALVAGVVMARYNGNPSSDLTGAQLAAVAPAAPAPDAAQPPAGPAAVSPPAAAPAPPPLPAPPRAAAPVPRHPSRADIDACNRYAAGSHDAVGDTVKSALVGGAAGAGLGAAGGAIADGGRGAGKGAGIGALVGATAGTLFGLNEAHQQDAQVAAAYRECMRHRGYAD
jgi:hypothetical protein